MYTVTNEVITPVLKISLVA